MNNNAIYTVTTLRGALYGRPRCVGFYHEIEKAKDTIKNNVLDINEAGHYHYAVIEKVSPGIYHFDGEEIWFKWHHIKGYQQCDKPDNFKRVVCFSIG